MLSLIENIIRRFRLRLCFSSRDAPSVGEDLVVIKREKLVYADGKLLHRKVKVLCFSIWLSMGGDVFEHWGNHIP